LILDVDYTFRITLIIRQQLWEFKVEEDKLHLGVSEQKKMLNSSGLGSTGSKGGIKINDLFYLFIIVLHPVALWHALNSGWNIHPIRIPECRLLVAYPYFMHKVLSR
jgi:hypothetical protein